MDAAKDIHKEMLPMWADGPGIGTEICWVLFIYDAFIEYF
jgi:hypothetical protein